MYRLSIGLVAIVVAAAGVASPPPSASVSAASRVHSVTAKKSCHYITKKRHGKKRRVKVCHNAVAPSATATPTDTASPTPSPTATATATPTSTPPPTSTPTAAPTIPPARVVTQQVNGLATIKDTLTGNTASAGAFACGTYDELGDVASDGGMYLWIHADEQNSAFAAYTSTNLNFQVSGDTGEIYDPPLNPGGPPNGSGNMDYTELAPGQENQGWIEVGVPLQAGRFTVSWNENGAIPWTAFATFQVNPVGPTMQPSGDVTGGGTCNLITPSL